MPPRTVIVKADTIHKIRIPSIPTAVHYSPVVNELLRNQRILPELRAILLPELLRIILTDKLVSERRLREAANIDQLFTWSTDGKALLPHFWYAYHELEYNNWPEKEQRTFLHVLKTETLSCKRSKS